MITIAGKERPKVFISYSWHPESDKQKVINIAERLVTDGVYVVLDQWELEVGNDRYAYMEQMVNDTSIDKVLLFCNKDYAEKSNNRKGGVGIEGTIVSPEVYEKTSQTKFIPIILQKDDNGNAYVPTYLKSLIFIDMSDEESKESGYDKLLRDLYKKPALKRPPIGQMPSYLDESDIFLSTAGMVASIRHAILNGNMNVKFLTKDYIRKFFDGLRNFIIDYKQGDVGVIFTNVEKSIATMMPLKEDFLEMLQLMLDSGQWSGEDLLDFFEKILQFYENNDIDLDTSSDRKGVSFDNFRFFNYDLFLSTAAILLKCEKYKELQTLVKASMFVEQKARFEGSKAYNFTRFRQYNYALDKFLGVERRRISLTADMLVRGNKFLSLQEIVRTDILLYYLSKFYPSKSIIDRYWYPVTSIYNNQISILPRLVSRRHFEKIKVLFDINSTEELKRKIDSLKTDDIRDVEHMVPKIKTGLCYDTLCSVE